MKSYPVMGLMLALATACSSSSSDTSTATEDGTTGSALSDTPDPSGKCDPAAINDLIVNAYVAQHAAASSASTTTPPAGPHGRHGRDLALLGYVYDADGSGVLEDAEQQAIVSDFTAGCSAIAAKLLQQYDTNADGTLDATELAAAHAKIDANRPQGPDGRHHCDGAPPDGGTPPEGDRDGDRDHDGDRGGHDGPPPADGARPDPKARLVAAYDTNADGTLDATELAAMRADVRARIAAGEPPFAPPAPPPGSSADAGN